jgi:hypothetical protein
MDRRIAPARSRKAPVESEVRWIAARSTPKKGGKTDPSGRVQIVHLSSFSALDLVPTVPRFALGINKDDNPSATVGGSSMCHGFRRRRS